MHVAWTNMRITFYGFTIIEDFLFMKHMTMIITRWWIINFEQMWASFHPKQLIYSVSYKIPISLMSDNIIYNTKTISIT